MKTLIVYYSFTNNNEVLAKVLQQKLQCDIHKIEELRPRKAISILFDLIFNRIPRIKPYPYSIMDYDQCIFIAPIWAGKIASPLKSFLIEQKYHVNQYSFITVCGGNPGQREKLFKSLTRILEKEPRQLEELWVNDLLPDNKKNTNKYTSGYRIAKDDLSFFSAKIDKFVKSMMPKTANMR